jgi:hypothetical protein
MTTIILASIVGDFDSGIGWLSEEKKRPYTGIDAFAVGIAALFPLAKQYNTTPGEIINLTSKYVSLLLLCSHGFVLTFFSWSIFLLGEWLTSNVTRRNSEGRTGQDGVVYSR